MTVQFLVTDNQVAFDVSGVGPQGATGPSGASFAALASVTESQTLVDSQAGSLFSNTGATGEVNLTLPVAGMPVMPIAFSLYVAENETFSFIAPAGVTIQNGADGSSAGGSISSNTVGNLVTIALISATLWVVTNIVGIWDFE